MKLTPLERQVFSGFMEQLDDKFTCAGSNDYELKNSEEARILLKEMIKTQYSAEDQEEALERLESNSQNDCLYTSDFVLFNHLLGKINQILDQKEKIFKLNYWVQNGGDGSAIVRFEPIKEVAETKDESQSEGWGESSADSISIMMDGGKLFYQSYQMIDGKFTSIWVEINEE
jgi:hypothetical protein